MNIPKTSYLFQEAGLVITLHRSHGRRPIVRGGWRGVICVPASGFLNISARSGQTVVSSSSRGIHWKAFAEYQRGGNVIQYERRRTSPFPDRWGTSSPPAVLHTLRSYWPGWLASHPQIRVSPKPLDVTLFGNRVFADANMLRWDHSGLGRILNPVWLVLLPRRGKLIHTGDEASRRLR